jgi:hypothetical protein
MLQEIRVTLGLYARKPVFTAAVVGVLALGIGANICVFGLAWNLLYRPLPYEDPGSLVRAGSSGGGIEAEVIGVVGDVRFLTLTETSEVEIYRPFAQRLVPVAQIAVKARGSPTGAVGVLREVVRSLDPELPLTQLSTGG